MFIMFCVEFSLEITLLLSIQISRLTELFALTYFCVLEKLPGFHKSCAWKIFPFTQKLCAALYLTQREVFPPFLKAVDSRWHFLPITQNRHACVDDFVCTAILWVEFLPEILVLVCVCVCVCVCDIPTLVAYLYYCGSPRL